MVRITCTISVSTGDEPFRGSYSGSLDDHYRRVTHTPESDPGSYKEDVSDIFTENDPGDTPADLATFFGGCSLHGANHIFVEGKKFGPRQALWALCFLLALSLFLFQVGDRVAFYLTYGHVTMLDEWNAASMIFPAITLCNYNTFRRSALSYSDLLFMGPLLGYEDNMAPGFQLAPEPDRQGARFSLAEFYNRTRHRMEDMMLDCSFAGKECRSEHWREVQELLRHLTIPESHQN